MSNTVNTKRPSIFPLLMVMFFDHTSLNITFPVLTLIFFDASGLIFSPDTSHAVRSMWYGLCVSIPHIVNLVMTPILSSLSDVYGRKKILLLGTLGAFLFAVIAGLGVFFGMLSLLFLGRIIQGAFSRTNPIAQAVVGDISEQTHKIRNMGYLQFAISIGAFLGPLLGGYFAHQFYFQTLNFSLPYIIAAIFAGISCLLALFMFKETHTCSNGKTLRTLFNVQTAKKMVRHPTIVAISILLLLSQISWSLYYQFIPPVLNTQLHFDAHALGLFVGLVALWLALATGFGIRMLQAFFTVKQMLFVSLYLVLIGLIGTVFVCEYAVHVSKWVVWLAAIPTAMGDVIAYSCLIAMYSDVVERDEQGRVMGVCFIVVAFIWSLTALLGGMMMSLHALLPLWIAPLGILVSLYLLHSSFGRRLFKIEPK